MAYHVYYRVSCQLCDHFVTVQSGELTRWMLTAPECGECEGRHWVVGEPRRYYNAREDGVVFDQEAENEPRPIRFNEQQIKKEFSTCMAELHLWLETPEAKAAATAAMYDPRGPWS